MLQYISTFNAQIIHIPGAENELADALSRPIGMVTEKIQVLGEIGHTMYEKIKAEQMNCPDSQDGCATPVSNLC